MGHPDLESQLTRLWTSTEPAETLHSWGSKDCEGGSNPTSAQNPAQLGTAVGKYFAPRHAEQPRGLLDPATKTTIRVENIQGTAIYNGTCLFYVNDVYAGGIFDLDYTGFYSNPQSVALGIVSNNVGAFDLYASNLVIDTFEVLDYTERYNGTFTSNDGKTVTVVNGIITAAV